MARWAGPDAPRSFSLLGVGGEDIRRLLRNLEDPLDQKSGNSKNMIYCNENFYTSTSKALMSLVRSVIFLKSTSGH